MIDSQTSVAGAPVSAQHEEQDRTVPVPTIGLYGGWAFGPRLARERPGQRVQEQSNGHDGHLVDAQANLLWRVTPHLAVGLGYRYDDYRLTSTRDDFHGRVDDQLKGPQMFLELGF